MTMTKRLIKVEKISLKQLRKAQDAGFLVMVTGRNTIAERSMYRRERPKVVRKLEKMSDKPKGYVYLIDKGE